MDRGLVLRHRNIRSVRNEARIKPSPFLCWLGYSVDKMNGGPTRSGIEFATICSRGFGRNRQDRNLTEVAKTPVPRRVG